MIDITPGRPSSLANAVVICVDMGTTNTRAWLVAERKIVARRDASVGVRDSARTGSTQVVRDTLRDLVRVLQTEAEHLGLRPGLVLGAGMITSSLGLLEVNHVLAPAGEDELAASIREVSHPQVTDLPVWLVPGVRTGPAEPEIGDLPDVDVIRGEETLCMGLKDLGLLGPRSTLLNLGSHWKAITLDSGGRIVSSFTTLSGELIHTVQKHTVLASALPPDRLAETDFYWLAQGREQQQTAGISRALFCVRILEQRFNLTPVQRASFLIGAVVGSDLAAVSRNKRLGDKIVLAGSGAVADAWKHFLQAEGRQVRVCNQQEIETAFVAGLLQIAELRRSGVSKGKR